MRNPLLSSLALSTLSLLPACGSTGGTFLGLFPLPKSLAGEIANDRYIAPDRAFAVGLPHATGSYEYTYMEVAETRAESGTHVQFGPAAFDRNLYLASLFIQPNQVEPFRFEGASERTFGKLLDLMAESGGGRPMSRVHSARSTVNGHPVLTEVFRQNLTSGAGSRFAVLRIVDGGDGRAAVVGALVHHPHLAPDELQEKLIASEVEPASTFLASFEFLEVAPPTGR